MHISTGHNNWLAWIDAAPWKYYSFDIYWILCHLLIWLTFVYLIDVSWFVWLTFLYSLIDIYQIIWLMFLDSCDWHWLDIYMTWHLYIVFYAHERVFFKVLCFKLFIYIFTSAKLFPYLFTPVGFFDLKLINDLLNSIFTNVLN